MRPVLLLGVAPLFVSHALAACSGMNAADQGTCPANTCQTLTEDFSSSNVLVPASSYTAASSSNVTFVSEQSPDLASVQDGNLVLSLKRSGTGSTAAYVGTTVYFTRSMHYGTVTARIQSGSTAAGVISSLQLQDDSGSSIDLDWVGLSSNRVQANYYTNNQLQLSQAAASIISVDPTSTFVEYKIVWLPDSLTWYANGFAVRTVKRQETWAEGEQRFNYPSKPARLSFSIWDSSKSINPTLTQQWAGSLQPQSSDASFEMLVKSVTVQCYSNSTSTVNTAHSANTLDIDTSTTDQQQEQNKQQSSLSGSTKSATDVDLTNFGLTSIDDNESSGDESSSSPLVSSDAPTDDLSKWLAGLNSPLSSSSWQTHIGGFNLDGILDLMVGDDNGNVDFGAIGIELAHNLANVIDMNEVGNMASTLGMMMSGIGVAAELQRQAASNTGEGNQNTPLDDGITMLMRQVLQNQQGASAINSNMFEPQSGGRKEATGNNNALDMSQLINLVASGTNNNMDVQGIANILGGIMSPDSQVDGHVSTRAKRNSEPASAETIHAAPSKGTSPRGEVRNVGSIMNEFVNGGDISG
ncbi:putative glycosidase CRH2, partial [Coemansia erecta]